MSPRARRIAHVDQVAHLDSAEETDQRLEGASRVPQGVDRRQVIATLFMACGAHDGERADLRQARAGREVSDRNGSDSHARASGKSSMVSPSAVSAHVAQRAAARPGTGGSEALSALA